MTNDQAHNQNNQKGENTNTDTGNEGTEWYVLMLTGIIGLITNRVMSYFEFNDFTQNTISLCLIVVGIWLFISIRSENKRIKMNDRT